MHTYQKKHVLAALAASIAVCAAPAALSQEEPGLVVNGEEFPQSVIEQLAERIQLDTTETSKRFAGQVLAAQEAEKLTMHEKEQIKQAIRMAEIEVLSRAYIDHKFSEIEVSDEEIEEEYNSLVEQLEGKQEYLVRHILVSEEETANELRDEIDGDEILFTEKAGELSLDSGSAENGGLLGWVQAEQFVEPFAEALLELEEDEISEPVQTQFGWHLILLEDEREAKAPSLDKIRAQVENQVKNVKFSKHMEQLQEAAEISISDKE